MIEKLTYDKDIQGHNQWNALKAIWEQLKRIGDYLDPDRDEPLDPKDRKTE